MSNRTPAAALTALALLACSPAPPRIEPPPSASASAAVSSSPAPSAQPASNEDIAPEAATGWRTVKPVAGKKHMVASANPHASEAGIAMLRAGGSAVDAAVAMAAVLTLVEPQSSGIGGGAFMLHFDPSPQGGFVAYDGRETAPKAATEDMFLGPDGKPRKFYDAVVGGLSVGVPGEIAMLHLAHQKHGKLPWAKLFEPAIALCDKGFAVSARLHELLARDKHLAKQKAAAAYFLGPDGKPKAVGTILENPALAAVFRDVAKRGPDGFYKGKLAQDMVAAVKAHTNPGRLTTADLAGYRPVARKPVCAPYRDRRVCGMPPPTSGGVTTLQILGLLKGFELSALKPAAPRAVHLVAEASRLAFADRARYLADPDFVPVPVAGLLDPAYLAGRAKQIRANASMGVAKPGQVAAKSARFADDEAIELPSTSHLVVVDGDGRVVSMTASIETAFGSHVFVRGFLLNNELTDFSFRPKVDGKPVANRIAPGKRPRSSMAPVIVFDAKGRFSMAVGSPGGSRIIGYVARTLVAMIDWKLGPQEAINLPNFLNRNGATELEKGAGGEAWRSATKAALEGWGHEVKVRDLNSGLQAIERVPAGLRGGADPRREGVVLAD